MTVKLYHARISPPVRAVLFALKILNVDHELVNVDLLKKEHKSDEYLKINPQGTIPTLVDDGFVVIDSHAINAYLVSKYAKDDKLYPKDIKARSIVDHRLFFDAGVLFTTLRNVAFKIFIEKSLTSFTPDMIESFENAYSSLEKFLNGSSYVAGDNITIADFSVTTTLASMSVLVPVKKEKFPVTFAYMERCKKTLPYYSEINEPGVNDFRQYLVGLKFQFVNS